MKLYCKRCQTETTFYIVNVAKRVRVGRHTYAQPVMQIECNKCGRKTSAYLPKPGPKA